MITHRYSIWKEKPTSRPALIITDDDGRTYNKVAVFRNEESAKVFYEWFEVLLREYAEMIRDEAIPIEWLETFGVTRHQQNLISNIIGTWREEQKNETD